MYISFQHVDDDYYGKTEYIKPIVEIASKNAVYVSITCEILNTYSEYSESITNKVKQAMKFAEYKVKSSECDIEQYRDLCNKMEHFYYTIVDDDFGKVLKQKNETLYWDKGLRYPDRRIARYRGLLFEELVTELVRKRFADEEINTGCRIYINHSRIIAKYGEGNASHKETIDIAAWKKLEKYGEFYECKINPTRFLEENYRYLVKIIETLKQNKVQTYIVAFVSADSSEHVNAQRKYLEMNDKNQNTELLAIGRENLFEIACYEIPNMA